MAGEKKNTPPTHRPPRRIDRAALSPLPPSLLLTSTRVHGGRHGGSNGARRAGKRGGEAHKRETSREGRGAMGVRVSHNETGVDPFQSDELFFSCWAAPPLARGPPVTPLTPRVCSPKARASNPPAALFHPPCQNGARRRHAPPRAAAARRSVRLVRATRGTTCVNAGSAVAPEWGRRDTVHASPTGRAIHSLRKRKRNPGAKRRPR